MNINRLVYLDDIKKERVKLLCKWWGGVEGHDDPLNV